MKVKQRIARAAAPMLLADVRMRWGVTLLALAVIACDGNSRTVPGPSSTPRRQNVDGGASGADRVAPGDGPVGADLGFFDAGPPPDLGFNDGSPVDSGVHMDAAAPIDVGFFDAATPIDTGAAADAGPPPDSGPPPDGGANPSASAQIALVRSQLDGPISVSVADVVVTYVRPAVGLDGAGFFVQAERDGPAMFVLIEPSLLSPPPQPGDIVRFTATVKETQQDKVVVSAVTGWARTATRYPLSTLVKDVSNAPDLLSDLAGYESELIETSLTIAGAFGAAGGGHLSARVDTPGLIGETDLVLRLPATVQDAEGLGGGCALTVSSTPMWRFHAVAQISGWTRADLTVASCPAPRVVQAAAQRPTRVAINVDRLLEPSSVLANGSQLSFSGGLRATGASVLGSTLIVTTTQQTAGLTYSVSVASSVTDKRGQSISAAFNSASFVGVATTAIVQINELNANVTAGCDLVELRVVQGGSLDGWQLLHRQSTLVSFSGLTVSTNDYIVVHAGGGSAICNPGGASSESGRLDQPAALYPGNFDSALDFHSTGGGITRTDNVITLYDENGNIADALLVADDPTGTTSRDTESAAVGVATAGEWTTIGGTVPLGGFVDDDFCAHAVTDLDATGLDASGTSIQRSNNTDSNNRLGWTDANLATWGANNPGQTNF